MAKSKLKGRKENHKFDLEREREIERKREAIRVKKVRMVVINSLHIYICMNCPS